MVNNGNSDDKNKNEENKKNSQKNSTCSKLPSNAKDQCPRFGQ